MTENNNKKQRIAKMDFFENFIVAITCLATPISVLFHSPKYLYSPIGFADGGDMYSHIAEAIHLKELLQNGTTNFWFDQVSLGYPMFTAYQPLPCFFVAFVMALFDRWISPLLIFRLIFVAVLMLMPLTAYKSAKMFGMHPLQAIFLCLITFTIQSWRKFGLEISAFVEYGLMTQAFGMLLLPLAVSSFYTWLFSPKSDNKSSTLAFLTLTVTFLSNFFFGLYACILSALMLIIKLFIISKSSSIASKLSLICSFACIHLNWILFISWWIISCMLGYKYIGGLPWRAESENGYPISFLLNKLTNGEIFDHGRSFPWLTLLVLAGFIINNIKVWPFQLYGISSSRQERIFSSWLILSTITSVLLFLGRTTFSVLYDLIPFHTELETVKYLNAVHFCGFLHASTALAEIVRQSSKLFFRVTTLCFQTSSFVKPLRIICIIYIIAKICDSALSRTFKAGLKIFTKHRDTIFQSILTLIIAVLFWCNQFVAVGTQLTMTEVNSDFVQRLSSLKSRAVEGRILGHRELGTASSWDLAFIPLYTGKPGLMTYSRGYHDSLSIFYLESLAFDPQNTQKFTSLLRMYNIHFLVTSWQVKLDESFMKTCQMKHLATIEDLVFYELLHQDSDYGYFDFVRIAGNIRGDLKLIRESVLKTLDIYSVNSVMKINQDSIHDEDVAVVDVKTTGWLERLRDFNNRKAQVTWSWKQKQNDSRFIIDGIAKENSWKWIYSQVVEERVLGVEYQAVVQVSDAGLNSSDYEHLLLKVTYHPFWRCFYYPVSDDFTISSFSQPQFLDGKTYLTINHVTPNLMSVTLPPGRYLIVFTYRFPGILKMLACVFVLCYVRILVRYFKKEEVNNAKTQRISKDENEKVTMLIYYAGSLANSLTSLRKRLSFCSRVNVIFARSYGYDGVERCNVIGGNQEMLVLNGCGDEERSKSGCGEGLSIRGIGECVENANERVSTIQYLQAGIESNAIVDCEEDRRLQVSDSVETDTIVDAGPSGRRETIEGFENDSSSGSIENGSKHDTLTDDENDTENSHEVSDCKRNEIVARDSIEMDTFNENNVTSDTKNNDSKIHNENYEEIENGGSCESEAEVGIKITYGDDKGLHSKIPENVGEFTDEVSHENDSKVFEDNNNEINNKCNDKIDYDTGKNICSESTMGELDKVEKGNDEIETEVDNKVDSDIDNGTANEINDKIEINFKNDHENDNEIENQSYSDLEIKIDNEINSEINDDIENEVQNEINNEINNEFNNEFDNEMDSEVINRHDNQSDNEIENNHDDSRKDCGQDDKDNIRDIVDDMDVTYSEMNIENDIEKNNRLHNIPLSKIDSKNDSEMNMQSVEDKGIETWKVKGRFRSHSIAAGSMFNRFKFQNDSEINDQLTMPVDESDSEIDMQSTEDNGIKTWKVKGRFRSHSIAAGSKFNENRLQIDSEINHQLRNMPVDENYSEINDQPTMPVDENDSEINDQLTTPADESDSETDMQSNEDNGIKTWKVKGRFRSHSIAAGSKFNENRLQIDSEINNQLRNMPVDENYSEINDQPIMPVDENDSEINDQPIMPVDENDSEINDQLTMPVDENDSEINDQLTMPADESDSETDMQCSEDNGIKTWKVKGRFRSHSIAAGSKFNENRLQIDSEIKDQLRKIPVDENNSEIVNQLHNMPVDENDSEIDGQPIIPDNESESEIRAKSSEDDGIEAWKIKGRFRSHSIAAGSKFNNYRLQNDSENSNQLHTMPVNENDIEIDAKSSEDDGIEAWKVKGRFRSHSIAAGSKFNTDTISNLINNTRHVQAGNANQELENNMEEESESSTDLKPTDFPVLHQEFSAGEIKLGIADQKLISDDSNDSITMINKIEPEIAKDSIIEDNPIKSKIDDCDSSDCDSRQECNHDNAAESDGNEEEVKDVMSGFLSHETNNNLEENLGKVKDAESFDEDSYSKTSPGTNSNSVTEHPPAIANQEPEACDSGPFDSGLCDSGTPDSGPYDSGPYDSGPSSVATDSWQGGQLSDSENESITDLRHQLEKMYASDPDKSCPQENYGKMVKELRQTYRRERRNTLSNLSSFKQ